MAVMTTAIRRVELATLLPQLAAGRREDLAVGLGVELTRRLHEHAITLASYGELKEAESKQRQREEGTNSACSSAKSNQRGSSALSQHSSADRDDTTLTADDQNDRVITPITTRFSVILHFLL